MPGAAWFPPMTMTLFWPTRTAQPESIDTGSVTVKRFQPFLSKISVVVSPEPPMTINLLSSKEIEADASLPLFNGPVMCWSLRNDIYRHWVTLSRNCNLTNKCLFFTND